MAEFVDACTKHVREAADLLLDAWSGGSFATYDYFYAQYLFAASSVLCLTALLGVPGHAEDADRFEAAFDVLTQLKASGHLAAAEFHRHVEAIRADLANLDARLLGGGGGDQMLQAGAANDGGAASAYTGALLETLPLLSCPQDGVPREGGSLHFIDDYMFSDILQGMYWSGTGNGF